MLFYGIRQLKELSWNCSKLDKTECRCVQAIFGELKYIGQWQDMFQFNCIILVLFSADFPQSCRTIGLYVNQKKKIFVNRPKIWPVFPKFWVHLDAQFLLHAASSSNSDLVKKQFEFLWFFLASCTFQFCWPKTWYSYGYWKVPVRNVFNLYAKRKYFLRGIETTKMFWYHERNKFSTYAIWGIQKRTGKSFCHTKLIDCPYRGSLTSLCFRMLVILNLQSGWKLSCLKENSMKGHD